MFASGVDRRHLTERAWTEHLAATAGVVALLDVVGRADIPALLSATLRDAVRALEADAASEQGERSLPLVTHQLHLGGRYPDVTIHDRRGQVLAVIEAQRGRADDHHIAKLAAHYVPESGARLGVLVAERWDPRRAVHPAWPVCPAPVVVVEAFDALHEIDYRIAWVHHPAGTDE